MHKLKLDVESLTVESFDAGAEAASPGTVHALEAEPTPLVKTLPLSTCVYSACATCGIYC